MKILFLCRWKLTNVLTVSTVMPHLRALVALEQVSKIVFVTQEADLANLPDPGGVDSVLHNPKLQWQPIRTFTGPIKLLNQIADVVFQARDLEKIARAHAIDIIIAHGSPMGAQGLHLGQKLQIPFYVSLFEPHADYMLESGVWKRSGVKYQFQKYWEQQQVKLAEGLMPVTQGYTDLLVQQEVDAGKLYTVPCAVNANDIKFDVQQREQVREQLGWQNATIGIYVGKFGDLYYKEEAFRLYSRCFDLIPDFRLIILSPQDTKGINRLLQRHRLDRANVFVASVPNAEVPPYLSAADFAFATYKPSPSKKYLSPMKIGEYWASGLPVLLTAGIGEDSDIIQNEGGGALFNLQEKGSVERAIGSIRETLKLPNHRDQIRKLAIKYRSPELVSQAYKYFFVERNDG